MSILLIGQRNRLYPPQRQNFQISEDHDDFSRTKKKEKERYRLDLLEQMKEGHERRRKQKIKEFEQDKYYQRLFYQQLGKPQYNYQTQPNHASRYQARNIEFSTPKQRRHKEQSFSLPPIERPSSFKSKCSRLHTEPVSSSFQNKYSSKHYTENTFESDKPNNGYSNIFQSSTAEVRQKKLQDELENKIKEIYSLIQQSSKTMEQTEQLDKIASKLTPIRLDLQRKGYKIRSPEPISPSLVNPEDNKDYYKLPNITQDYRYKQFSEKESQEEWRQWYSKEKLKELQSRYQRDLNLHTSDIRLNHRSHTPRFQL